MRNRKENERDDDDDERLETTIKQLFISIRDTVNTRRRRTNEQIQRETIIQLRRQSTTSGHRSTGSARCRRHFYATFLGQTRRHHHHHLDSQLRIYRNGNYENNHSSNSFELNDSTI